MILPDALQKTKRVHLPKRVALLPIQFYRFAIERVNSTTLAARQPSRASRLPAVVGGMAILTELSLVAHKILNPVNFQHKLPEICTEVVRANCCDKSELRLTAPILERNPTAVVIGAKEFSVQTWTA